MRNKNKKQIQDNQCVSETDRPGACVVGLGFDGLSVVEARLVVVLEDDVHQEAQIAQRGRIVHHALQRLIELLLRQLAQPYGLPVIALVPAPHLQAQPTASHIASHRITSQQRGEEDSKAMHTACSRSTVPCEYETMFMRLTVQPMSCRLVVSKGVSRINMLAPGSSAAPPPPPPAPARGVVEPELPPSLSENEEEEEEEEDEQ